MFDADWTFNCATCGEKHPPGTPAEYNKEDRIQAVVCPEPRTILPRGTTVKDGCNKCFLVHSPAQNGCE